MAAASGIRREVELRDGSDVSGNPDRAAHDDERPQLAHRLRIPSDRQGEIGQGGRRVRVSSSGNRRIAFQQEPCGVFGGPAGGSGGRLGHAAESVVPVDFAGRDSRTEKRGGRPRRDRDGRGVEDVEDGQGVWPWPGPAIRCR